MSYPEASQPETSYPEPGPHRATPHAGAGAVLSTAAELAGRLAADAAARDRAGGIPHAALALLRESGLLSLAVPAAHGGAGVPWSVLLAAVRIIARADAAIAHLLGYHYIAVVSPAYRSHAAHAEHYYRVSADPAVFWGNAVNAASRSLKGERQADGGYVLNGWRPYSSGAPGSDYLIISWEDGDADRLLFGAIPTGRAGVTVRDDWDSFGQRQTGSGTTTFENVRVEAGEILDEDARRDQPFNTIGPALSQSVLLNVFTGVAEGALEAARDYAATRARPWGTSGVERAVDDPGIQRQFGELYIRTLAAAALADRAGAAVDRAWAEGEALDETTRGETAVAVAAANVLAGEVALEVTSRIFDVMGTRATGRTDGFDRFWRNVRVHTLHNPAEYKLRNLGRWYATGAFPVPGHYS